MLNPPYSKNLSRSLFLLSGLLVMAGKSTLRTQKKIDDEHELFFVKQLKIVHRVPQRISVQLDPTQLAAQ